MLLSTEAEVRDRVRGLTTGADEYVGKPYDPGYVVARARELVRRSAAPATQRRETVLVIDDSITFREALKTALEERLLSRCSSPAAARTACASPPTCGRPRSSSTACCPASTARPSSGASGSTRRCADSLPAAHRLGGARRGGAGARCRRRRLRAQGRGHRGDPRPPRRHAAERRRAAPPIARRRACRAEEDPRGRRQRNLPAGARRGAARGRLRSGPGALRRGGARAARRVSRSTASCSTS